MLHVEADGAAAALRPPRPRRGHVLADRIGHPAEQVAVHAAHDGPQFIDTSLNYVNLDDTEVRA
jgi:hypothetical protein